MKNLKNAFALAALTLASGLAAAAPITPTFTTFGTLAGATFNPLGPSGIPNTAVAITTLGDLTLGLTAHQRFVPPIPVSDGAGTFTASAGVSQQAPSPADPYALWNFAFYIGGASASQYLFQMFYDFDPAAGNDQATHGVITFPGSAMPTNPSQNSWNLGMNFLSAPAMGLTPPAGAFNPNVSGEYTFAIAAYGLTSGQEVARTAIRVNVLSNDVPEPGTLALAGLALLGLGAARRRRG